MAGKKRELKINEQAVQELDKRIQEMALLDFEAFCKMFNIDKSRAFVCFEIKKKKSLKQIGLRLGIGKSAVYAIAKDCESK